ncbi:MAG: response regulator [Calditrichaeota bacterium]|nr:MAG: response regulator [Calditrichota bacterium]
MKKILFVDDDPNMQRMVEILLRNEDLELIFAGNGRSALKQMDRHDFDMIFSDIQMPEMDGLTLLAEVRSRQPHLPFIIISAFGQESMEKKALDAGASRVLNKPFDRDKLLSIINDFG